MKKPEYMEQSIGLLISDVTRLMRRNFDRYAKDLGLTRAQWTVLVHLIRCEGIRQAALADILEVEPITLVRLLDKLEAAGLVERRPDPNDRRAHLLYLQKSAESTLNKIWEIGVIARDEALAGLSEQEKDTMVALLQRIKANLSEKEGPSNTDGGR